MEYGVNLTAADDIAKAAQWSQLGALPITTGSFSNAQMIGDLVVTYINPETGEEQICKNKYPH